MRCLIYSILLPLLAVGSLAAASVPVQGRVLEVLPEANSLRVELTESAISGVPVGQTVDFSVGPGDLEIGYVGRLIRAEAVAYSSVWHLERVFPVDGIGAKAMIDINKQLHDATATMSRRKYVRKGDYIPSFAMIDQHGDFLQIREMRGQAFVLNFIFTRCRAATMCPASTTRMSELQEIAREGGMEDLNFVTITFDPEYDSPGILRQYAESYGLENENFHLLTATQELVDDLLRQFGILTMEEDGTINHTMATLLVDANGRVAFRKEGSKWTTQEFIKEAKQL
ncbi:MAG: protein SCO1/2 [Lentimonas sp.]|jgi:protein SCO1/2